MNPRLRRDIISKTGDDFVLSLPEGDRLDSVLEAVQSRVVESRKKAEDIKNEAQAEAISINENAKPRS